MTEQEQAKEKQLTAMQELIEDFKAMQKDWYKAISIEAAIELCSQQLEKEKQQIMDAVKYGFNDAQRKQPDLSFEQYYNNTFKTE